MLLACLVAASLGRVQPRPGSSRASHQSEPGPGQRLPDRFRFPIKLNNKLAALLGVVESSESRPTDQSREVFRHLSALLDEQISQMGIVIRRDLGRLNELLIREGLEPIEDRRLVS